MNLKEKILHVLVTVPASRDCDSVLAWNVINKNNEVTINYTLFDFLFDVKHKNKPSLETIQRIGRLIKKESPHLRGREYILRQTKKQEKAKKDLGYIGKCALSRSSKLTLDNF